MSSPNCQCFSWSQRKKRCLRFLDCPELCVCSSMFRPAWSLHRINFPFTLYRTMNLSGALLFSCVRKCALNKPVIVHCVFTFTSPSGTAGGNADSSRGQQETFTLERTTQMPMNEAVVVTNMQSRFVLHCAIVLDEEVCLKVWIHVLLTVSPLG